MNPGSDRQPWRVLLLDTKRSNPNHYLCLAVQRALSARDDVAFVISPLLGESWELAQANKCNLFIAFDGEELHRGICARLAALCGRSVLWVTEDPYERPINTENSALFDLVFTNDSASVSAYGAKGRHLPLASSMDMHFHSVRNDADYLYDLFFAGTAWPNRVHLIKQLLTRIKNLKTKLILPHNEHLPAPDKFLDLPSSAYSWRMPNSQFSQFANRSRVVLSLHREFTASPGGSPMAETPGPRLFEVALAGGFQLVDTSLVESNRYFEEGKEYIGFSSAHDAAEKLEYFLNHPAERISIALAAQERARALHLYEHRVDQLLNEVKSLPYLSKPSPHLSRPIRILQVTHNIVGVPPFGGVEVYQDWVARTLRTLGGFECFFLVTDNTGLSRAIRLLDSQYRQIEEITFKHVITQEVLTDSDRESAFARLLTQYGIDVVHFQHLIGHVPSLPYVARAMGIPTMLSLHDYYTMCWQINLLDYNGHFCAPESISETTCDVCIGTQRGGLPRSQSCRRSFYGRMLSHIDIIHCNTKEVVRRFQAVYPKLMEHGGIRVHGVPIPDGPPTYSKKIIKPIRVALLGNFTLNKGADFLLRLFDQMRGDDIRFEVLGKIESEIEADVMRRNLPNVSFLGGYAPGQQAQLLNGVSIALFASKWPETYCLSLSEAWQAGLIPVAPNIGAFAERIEEGVNGFKYEVGQLGNLLDILRMLISDSQTLERMRSGLGEHLYSTASAHSIWLTTTYRDLASHSSAIYDIQSFTELEEPLVSSSGVTLTHPKWLRIGELALRDDVVVEHTTGNGPANGILAKTLLYLRRHGTVATVNRVMQEIRKRCENQGRG